MRYQTLQHIDPDDLRPGDLIQAGDRNLYVCDEHTPGSQSATVTAMGMFGLLTLGKDSMCYEGLRTPEPGRYETDEGLRFEWDGERALFEDESYRWSQIVTVLLLSKWPRVEWDRHLMHYHGYRPVER